MNTIASLIDGYINRQTKKQVVTREIENHLIKVLSQDGYWKQGGYHSFAESIENLAQQGIISPVKASGFNGRQPPIYEKYRIAVKNDGPDRATRQKLLTWYHPQINTAHYLTHFKDYKEDEPYLTRLDSFLKRHKDFASWPMITANERSFQIFHDEKWLLSSRGRLFCQRTGLSLDALRCYQTYEPFFYYPAGMPVNTDKINVLIVENKDTFFSLKGLFQQGINTWDGCAFSLLIYGEGRKIQKSFSFFGELGQYRNYRADFYYFGDLDPEGILIWHDLQREYGFSVKPFTLFYNALFDRYWENAPPLIDGKKAGQKYSEEAIKAFLAYFDKRRSAGILQMLEEKKYLPQEGLNYVLLKELAGKREG
ncbi:MAG: hypothetical protein PWP72_1992 [Thermoanaerobacter sp.]|nr:hypothetical protein [Thermoanaerobacter sp.]